ncbi:hypothetical protein [Gorillibacterium massiliense]|uniref:hypothetical protein n=1 Tax=Gorillibacterium massiliense TaxID=1280390 RepID=UPI0004AEA0A7|nr:hypothetical protein [Gorillibacterium massiliense]
MGGILSKRGLLFIAVVLLLGLAALYMNVLSPTLQEKKDKEALLASTQRELQQLRVQVAQKENKGMADADQEAIAKVRAQIPETPRLEDLLKDLHMLESVSRMQLKNYSFELEKDMVIPTSSSASTTSTASSDSATAQASMVSASPTPTPTKTSDENTVTTDDSAASKSLETNTSSSSLATAKINIKMVGKGDYSKLSRFLKELETNQRLMTLKKLEFKTPFSAPVQVNGKTRETECNLEFVAYYAPGLKKFIDNPYPVDYDPSAKRTNPIW